MISSPPHDTLMSLAGPFLARRVSEPYSPDYFPCWPLLRPIAAPALSSSLIRNACAELSHALPEIPPGGAGVGDPFSAASATTAGSTSSAAIAAVEGWGEGGQDSVVMVMANVADVYSPSSLRPPQPLPSHESCIQGGVLNPWRTQHSLQGQRLRWWWWWWWW